MTVCINESWTHALTRRVDDPFAVPGINPPNLDYPIASKAHISLEPRIASSVKYFAFLDDYVKMPLHVSSSSQFRRIYGRRIIKMLDKELRRMRVKSKVRVVARHTKTTNFLRIILEISCVLAVVSNGLARDNRCHDRESNVHTSEAISEIISPAS
jgi:hypothetical protein